VKSKSKKINETKEVMHIKIDRPISMRKEILKNAITATKLLQDYDEIKILRETKKSLFDELRSLGSEIIVLQRNLHNSIPSLPEEPTINKARDVNQTIPKFDFESVKEKTDVDKLKGELAEIEAKLKQLG